MLLVYLVVILVTLLAYLYAHVTRTLTYWKDRNVPGPKPVPLFGNLKESTLRRKNVGVVFRDMYNAFPNEKVIGIYRMTTPALLIRDLDAIKHIMIKDFDLFNDRGVEMSKEGLGENMFSADGDTWRALRNRFTPLFTSGKLKNMHYLMAEKADNLINYLDKKCDDQPEQEIHDLIQKFTMASISACAFGVDVDTLNDKIDALYEVDRLILTPTLAIEINLMYPGILKKLNSSIFPRKVKAFFSDLVKNVMSQRGGVPSNRKDFMDLILELRQQGQITTAKRSDKDETLTLELTDNMIAAQAFIFYIAGYETTATTVSFLLYLLALNPHIQDKLIEEIDQAIEEHNGVVDYDTVKSIQYLEKVFNETLRMYPIVEPLQRNAKVDYRIPGTDVVVKKGTTVLMSPMGIHNDEKYYPNPHIFDPERFSPEVAGVRHPCAFLPFGLGPRNCIGMRFAKTQGTLGVVKLLSKFRVEPSERTPKVMDFNPRRIIVGPKGGIPLKIVRRKK